MNKILLISEDQLKAGSTINSNLDNEFLTNQIWYVQQRYLRPLLGDDLYNQIETQFASSALTTANQTLLDVHITPILINYTTAEVLPLIMYRIDNIGVYTRGDANMQSVKHEEIELLALGFKNQASFFAEQMTKYLYQYQDQYPLFLNGNLTIDKIQPNLNTRANSAFYLGNGNRKRNIYTKGKDDC